MNKIIKKIVVFVFLAACIMQPADAMMNQIGNKIPKELKIGFGITAGLVGIGALAYLYWPSQSKEKSDEKEEVKKEEISCDFTNDETLKKDIISFLKSEKQTIWFDNDIVFFSVDIPFYTSKVSFDKLDTTNIIRFTGQSYEHAKDFIKLVAESDYWLENKITPTIKEDGNNLKKDQNNFTENVEYFRFFVTVSKK